MSVGDGKMTRWTVALLGVLVTALFGWGTYQQTTDARHDEELRSHAERIRANEKDNEWIKQNIGELKEIAKETRDEVRKSNKRP